jgi:hypothetical protein
MAIYKNIKEQEDNNSILEKILDTFEDMLYYGNYRLNKFINQFEEYV